MQIFAVNDLFLNSETLHALLDELQIHFARQKHLIIKILITVHILLIIVI